MCNQTVSELGLDRRRVAVVAAAHIEEKQHTGPVVETGQAG